MLRLRSAGLLISHPAGVGPVHGGSARHNRTWSACPVPHPGGPWCLEEFEYEGQTVMMAPASGFYTTPGLGKNEVRMAYVLKKEDLAKALTVLSKALEAYPGRML